MLLHLSHKSVFNSARVDYKQVLGYSYCIADFGNQFEIISFHSNKDTCAFSTNLPSATHVVNPSVHVFTTTWNKVHHQMSMHKQKRLVYIKLSATVEKINVIHYSTNSISYMIVPMFLLSAQSISLKPNVCEN